MAYDSGDDYWDALREEHDFYHEPSDDPVDGCEFCEEYVAEEESDEEAA